MSLQQAPFACTLFAFITVTFVVTPTTSVTQNELPSPHEEPTFPLDGVVFPVVPSQGACPIPPVVNNFRVNEFIGRWYETERFFAPFQTGDCVTADYSLFPNCSISMINSNVILGRLETVLGHAVSGSDPSKGELIVKFPGHPGEDLFQSDTPNYGVVATDYKNYAVIYGCSNVTPSRKFEYSWILGRRERINSDFLESLKRWLKQVGIQVERYMITNQQNCLRRPPQ